MHHYHRRFVFVDFDNLLAIKFKKLEKVCDRVFVFISSEVEEIPFDLVRHMQRMGKNIKWILCDQSESESFDYIISFLMGRLHQKVDKSVEFAVLSDDDAFDGLIGFINGSGRSCIRVKQAGMEEDKAEVAPAESVVEEPATIRSAVFSEPQGNGNGNHHFEETPFVKAVVDSSIIEKSAENTIKRLIRSGNRPSNIHLLKDYILLNNQ